jgi:hypothetical protein
VVVVVVVAVAVVVVIFCPSILTPSLSAGYRGEDRGILVRFVEATTKSSKTPDKTEIHPASYSMGNGNTVHDGKVAGARSWIPFSAKVNNKWSYISSPSYAFLACIGTALFHCHKQEPVKTPNSTSSRFPSAFMMNFLRQNLKAS